MSNEEAKAILTEYLDMDSDVNSEYLEAMRVAIKALETPPNDDWEKYSDKLWKIAYERGKAEALEKQSNIHDKCKKCVEFSEQVSSHLTDRPCSVCEFHIGGGCSKWSCVFEENEE